MDLGPRPSVWCLDSRLTLCRARQWPAPCPNRLLAGIPQPRISAGRPCASTLRSLDRNDPLSPHAVAAARLYRGAVVDLPSERRELSAEEVVDAHAPANACSARNRATQDQEVSNQLDDGSVVRPDHGGGPDAPGAGPPLSL